MISIDDFKKLDMRIGKILSAEAVPDADKLIKLMIDFGLKQSEDCSPDHISTESGLGPKTERDIRQILSAIREWYTPESLVGEYGLFVVNLEPRKIRGLESQGMLMAVGDDRPVFLVPKETVVLPARVR